VNEAAPIDRDRLLQQLRSNGIVPRRYFHPLIPEFQYYRSNASADPAHYPVAARVARQVLCLPIYPDLAMAEHSSMPPTPHRGANPAAGRLGAHGGRLSDADPDRADECLR